MVRAQQVQQSWKTALRELDNTAEDIRALAQERNYTIQQSWKTALEELDNTAQDIRVLTQQRNYTVQQSWKTALQELDNTAEDIRALAQQRNYTVQQSWKTALQELDNTAEDIRALAQERNYTIQQSWKTALEELDNTADDIRALAQQRQADLRSSWQAFFTQAAEIADQLRQQAAATANRIAAGVRTGAVQQFVNRRAEEQSVAASAEQMRARSAYLLGQSGTIELGPGGAGFSGGYTASQRQEANLNAIRAANKAQVSGLLEAIGFIRAINKERRDTLTLLQSEEAFERRLAALLERKAKAEQTKQRVQRAGGEALIGGAFPLLFGQGIGAAAGGGIGGAAGGFAGGTLGFGLALVGTAIGAQFDAAITSAKDFASSLKEGGDAATFLKERLGSLNPRIAEQIRNLQQSGQTAAAAELAMKELGRQIGTENARAFRQLGDDVNNANTNFQTFVTTVIAGVARMTQDLRKFAQDNPILFNLAGGAAGIGINPLASLAASATALTGRPSQASAQQRETPEARQRTTELQSQYAISQQQLKLTTLSFETDSAAYVIARRRTAELELQAAKQKIAYDQARGVLSVKQKELELSIAQNTYQNQLNAIERERLNYIQQRAQKIQQQEEEAQRRAKQAAEEQLRNTIALYEGQNRLSNANLSYMDARFKEAEIMKGELQGLELRLAHSQNYANIEKDILITERDIALAQAKSAEQARLINEIALYKNATLHIEIQLRETILKRQIAQIKGAKELAKIEQAKAIESAKLNSQAEQVAIMLNAATTRGDTRSRDFLQATQLRIQQATETLNIRTKRTQLEKELALLQGTEGTADKQLEVTRQLELLGIEERKLNIVQQMQLEQLRLNQAAERYGGIITAVENGLTKTFDLLVDGTDNWGESLRNIAATVLKDIAKQLLQIYVIEQLLGFVRKALLPATPSISGANLSSAGIPNLSFDTPSLSGFNLNLMEAYSIGARATGGPVGANQPYMVGERGPELFVPRSSGTIVPNNALAGSGSVNVVVNVDASGSAVQGNDQQSSQLGRLIGAQVRQVLITEKRPGGLLAATR